MNRTGLPECVSRFLSGERLAREEFALLSDFLNDIYHQQVLFAWLNDCWQQSREEAVLSEFEQIRERIGPPPLKPAVNRLLRILSQAAAVLFIPLLALTVHLSRREQAGLLTLGTQKGEQAGVMLPDGTKVWLNVDTKLRYPADYGLRSRSVELEGEAYFEVEGNEELPFEVAAGDVTVKATGTRFIVSAYPEQSGIRSSLIQGAVEITCGHLHTLLREGEQMVYHKDKSPAGILPFDGKYELAWKDNRLAFRLTPFAEVIAGLEKWYNITIEYDPELFERETLTVRFERYETLEQILRVMSKVHDFDYAIEDKKIRVINKKGGGS
jgi:ferric-dicitrate binding protein FerR (iron transport regulator)